MRDSTPYDYGAEAPSVRAAVCAISGSMAVATLVNGVVDATQPQCVRLIAIDGWFGPKWLGFAGKAIGAVACWSTESAVVVPPFVPNRVVQEINLERAGEGWATVALMSLHIAQSSESNLKRKLNGLVDPETLLLWIGRVKECSSRLSVLGYLISSSGDRSLYVSFLSGAIDQVRGLTREQCEHMLRSL